MTRWLRAVVVLIALAVPVFAQETPLTEVQKLRIENLQMKTALLQQQLQELQRQVLEANAKLESDWQALEKELREALKPLATHVFNRQKGLFEPPPVEEKKP